LFAPSRSIPPELLVKIFGCCDADFYSAEPDWAHVNVAECLVKSHLLQLSRVCSTWHTVVMGTPALWVNLAVDINQWQGQPHFFSGLPLASLERSNGCPLNLAVRMTGNYADNAGLELIAQNSQCWRSLHLATYSPAFQRLISRQGKLSFLEALDIRGRSLDTHNIFDIAPRLVEVTLHEYGVVKPPHLPWKQLRVLHCKTITANDLQAITDLISRCPNLAALNLLSLEFSGSPVPLHVPPIDTRIISFAVEMINAYDRAECAQAFSDLLGAFTLPCTRAISIQMNSKSRPLSWSQDAFLGLLCSSSGDIVTSLALRHIAITESDLLECLAHLPRLESLFITDVRAVHSVNPPSPECIVLTDTLLRALLWTSSSATCLIPNLQLFRCVSMFRFTPSVFLDFVRSRVQVARRFELRMYVAAPVPDDEFVAELRSLQRRGDIWFSLETCEAAFGDN
ncbi:hypothetical protein DFH06DRAFT_157253, partial [Mycena polygramma]